MLQLKQLNDKAMMVRLTISKPTTVRRDDSAEAFTQQALQDAGLKVSATLFKDKHNPVRRLLNSAGAVYLYHKQNTLPYIDRGPRLLPVENYERYRDEMRRLIGEVESELTAILPVYDQHVANDVALRNGTTGQRASVADYPTREQFEAGFKMVFNFSPLPDNSHWLFDVAEEDRAALEAQNEEIVNAARADLYARLRDPVVKLLSKLKVPAGDEGSIFRDTAVTNITAAVETARALAMGDETVLAMCDEVAQAIAGAAVVPDILRENVDQREATAAKLKAVTDKMAFMFAGAAG